MMCVVSCWYLPELGRVLVRSRGVVMDLETLPRMPNAARWSHFRRAWQIQRDKGGRRWDAGPKGRIRSGGGGAGGLGAACRHCGRDTSDPAPSEPGPALLVG